jgi:hypothetical protein
MTGIPVLGSVSIVRNREQTRKMRMQIVQYAMACGLLVTAYAGIMVFKV